MVTHPALMLRLTARIILGFALTTGTFLPAVATGPSTSAKATRGPHYEGLQIIGLPEDRMTFVVDWQAMALASLAKERASHSAAERAEFDDLMYDLVDQAFTRLLQSVREHDIVMLSEESRPDGLIRRKFIARSRKSPKDTIEFYLLLKRDKEEWALQDFATEDVSLVRVYRSQFLKILRNEGFRVLLGKMRAKIKRDAAELATPAK